MNLLEGRLDLQGGDLRVISAMCGRTWIEVPEGEGGRLEIDNLLRSIATQQSMQETDLRDAVRGQERLRSSIDKVIQDLNSVAKTLRDVDRKVQTLIGQHANREDAALGLEPLSNVGAPQ